jgi:flagellar biosynthesis/type III secretory pathway protein FliH
MKEVKTETNYIDEKIMRSEIAKAYQEGYDTGYDQGYKEGYEDGLDTGYARAERTMGLY